MIKKILAGAFLGLSLIGVSANADTYTVKQGDTLGEIATSHSIDLNELAQTNNIANVNLIYVGETLTVGQTRPVHVPVYKPTYEPLSVVSDTHSATYAAQRMAQGTGETADFWAYVIDRESGNNWDIWNASGHYGYFQINASLWNLTDFSVDGQINKAIEIYNTQGANAWQVLH